MDYSKFKYIKPSCNQCSGKQRTVEISYELNDLSYAEELRRLMEISEFHSRAGYHLEPKEPITIQLSPYLTLLNVNFILSFNASVPYSHSYSAYRDSGSGALIKISAVVYD